MSLSFSIIQKTSPVLIPGQTHEIEIRFQNHSEYDKQLYCTLLSPDGILTSKQHFDILVPAQGISIDTIKITLPDNNKIYYSNYFFVLETSDAVLDENKNFAFFLNSALIWKWSHIDKSQNIAKEGIAYLGKHHISICDNESIDDQTLIFTCYIACSKEESCDIHTISQYDCNLFIDDNLIRTLSDEQTEALTLHEGINKISIKSEKSNNTIACEFIQNSDYVPTSINPNFYR